MSLARLEALEGKFSRNLYNVPTRTSHSKLEVETLRIRAHSSELP